jgi:hypothetical protein
MNVENLIYSYYQEKIFETTHYLLNHRQKKPSVLAKKKHLIELENKQAKYRKKERSHG